MNGSRLLVALVLASAAAFVSASFNGGHHGWQGSDLIRASATDQAQLETPRLGERDQRKESDFHVSGDCSSFKFKYAAVGADQRFESNAALQLQVDKIGNPFLSTLPSPGSAQFLTVLKPCGILLPHVHQRATEFYSVLFGQALALTTDERFPAAWAPCREMSAGIAQENGGDQNITFTVNPGEVFVAPQGLMHFNHNRQCHANAFFQSFNSADPGALNVINALAALNMSGPNGTAAILASTAGGVMASPQKAFALDPACLALCQLDSNGAPGDGLDTLPHEIRQLFGI